MQQYEYKVVPAPAKGTKAKGVKTPQDRFANSVEIQLNQLAAEGWEYQRAELLPSEERSGLTSSVTNWRNVLIFRRALAPAPQAAAPAPAPEAAAAPAASAKEPAAAAPAVERRHSPEPVPLTAAAGDPEAPPGAVQVPGPGAAKMQADDGVEELSPVSGMTAALKARAGLADGKDDEPKDKD